MRNLKKFLALVMAMVMAFSLMLTVNAANPVKTFDDAGSIEEKFVEAADVLTGMKVFQGDAEAATFRPADTINRAEVAALIYRLATGDVDDTRAGLYANYGNFADVSENDWFAGYVGYCANAGYIKGHGGYFNPYDSVTGYETLAMILRVVGYDKNHEFEGATWQTNVSALSTQLGILTNIKTTHYGNTLHLASRRDVVAELLFQAVSKPNMVVYTPALGYQDYGMDGGLLGSRKNPTLGFHIFGLTEDTGIIVANQETGEANTRASFSLLPYGEDIYSYVTAKGTAATPDAWTAADAASDAINVIATFDVVTGLDSFAHKTTLWFDGRRSDWDGTLSATAARDNNNLHVYATFDRSTLVSAVKGWYDNNGTETALAKTVNTPNTPNTVGSAAKGKGFNVTTATKAYENMNFTRFIPANAAMDVGALTITPSTQNNHKDSVYLLISNSEDKSLDVVIGMTIESASVKGVDNVNKIKTVTVPRSADATDFIVADNELNSAGDFVLEQKQLVGDSAKTLKQKEMGVHIDGTATQGGTPKLPNGSVSANIGTAGYVPDRTGDTYDDAWFLLKPVTQTASGRVVAYDGSNGKIVLDNGQTLEQSVLYDTVVSGGGIPQQTSYSNITYTFYLDTVGKYLGASPSRDVSFVYGTYMDYSQATSSSAFEYFLTGINLDGEQVTVPVSKVNGTNVNATNRMNVPFRDTAGAADDAVNTRNGIASGYYKGWAFSGEDAWSNDFDTDKNTAGTQPHAIWNSTGMKRGESTTADAKGIFDNAALTTATNPDGIATALGDVFIGKTNSTLGAVKASATAGDGSQDLYFTENTKFILVSGYGTESAKAVVKNGISELRGSNTWVNLRMAALSQNVSPNLTTGKEHILKDQSMAYMTYYKTSDFVYAQTGENSLQADVVILPAAALLESGQKSLYYVGNANYTLINADGEAATQFTMYQDGEEKSVWVNGLPTDKTSASFAGVAGGSDAYLVNGSGTPSQGHDKFWNLLPTGKTANDGEPIYYLTTDGTGAAILPVTDDKTVISVGANLTTPGDVVYTAATYSAQTGNFTGATVGGAAQVMRNVANAKVVNVNAKNRGTAVIWPDITDLTTLNQAGSLKALGYGGADDLKVSAVLDPSNPLVVTCIYVAYDQN